MVFTTSYLDEFWFISEKEKNLGFQTCDLKTKSKLAQMACG